MKIRTARKAGRCAEFRHCGNRIEVGDRYAEGDVDPYKAGGFGRDRLCLDCGREAEAPVEAWRARNFDPLATLEAGA